VKSQNPLRALLVAVATVAVALAVAWAGGQGGAQLGGAPIIVWCAGLAFAVQWVAFVPSFLAQTEKYYDLVGSLTYISVTVFALATTGPSTLRPWLLGALVASWAGRLGTFLFRRVLAKGSDSRFDEIKTDPMRFFVAWTLQGLWVFLTLCAALAAITTRTSTELGILDGVGFTVWATGWSIEVVADRQKSRYREEHPEGFVDTGLWAWSRHPNYFGEIVLWTGVALIATSTLRGWQWVTLISPFFVAFLLMKVSGIPMLEQRADDRWGDREDYQRYKEQTPVLVPRPPSG